MVEVTKKSANWRLFGGGGLLLGGLLWAIGAIIAATAGGAVAGWLSVIGLLVIGIAHLFVAFGETGSNGAVGASMWGKLVLVVAALGWVLLAINGIIALAGGAAQGWMDTTGYILAIVGGLLAAIAIFGRGVAKGVAKWIMFLPVLLVALNWILGLAGQSIWWIGLIAAIAFLIAGIAYLFNKADINVKGR
jgi:hypothetical protein